MQENSYVNCMVGLMDINNGILEEELFTIDTTKLWIYGHLDIDFKKEYIQLSLLPHAKTARVFALHMPILVEGEFSDLKLIIQPIDIAHTYLSFLFSPLHVPVRLALERDIIKDDDLFCDTLFNRDYVKKMKAQKEKQDQQEVDELLADD